jgi:hypothetical protein
VTYVLTIIYIEPTGQSILDPSLFYLYENFEQQPMPIQVWDAKPLHYPPTCRLDKTLLEIVENLIPVMAIGGNAFEFANPKFPHVSALLNPQHHSQSYPVTAAIVQVSEEHKSLDGIGVLSKLECDPCSDSRKSS